MAKQNSNLYYHIHFTAILFLLILIAAQPSSARPLQNGYPLNSLAVASASDSILSVALPEENNVLPCDTAESKEKADLEGRVGSGRLVGNYGNMILSMLPKGNLPPSGPSKGTNSLEN